MGVLLYCTWYYWTISSHVVSKSCHYAKMRLIGGTIYCSIYYCANIKIIVS